jgi:putative transposase
MPKQVDYTLTEAQLVEVAQAMKSHNKNVAKRATMLHNLHQGYSPQEVATIHAMSKGTVYNTFNRYQAEGLEGLKNKPKSGRPAKADETYRQRLVEVVESSPQEHDLGFSVWTLPSLQAFMERETGIRLSQNRISEVLKDEGYVYRRPKKDLGHRQDPTLREQVQQAIDEVKKTHKQGMSDFSIWTKVDSI